MSLSKEEYFKSRVFEAVKSVVPYGAEFDILEPEVESHGDYATNAAFGLAKVEGKRPMEVAREIVEKLKSRKVERLNDRKAEKLKNITPTTRTNVNNTNKHDTNIRMNANDTNNGKAEKLKSRKVEKEEEGGEEENKDKKIVKLFEKIEAVAPGFVNFWISDKALLDFLAGVLESPEEWGKSDEGKGKTVVLDYFQPNIAKIPHIGHLRSAVIGDALKRIFLSQGYRAVSDTHIGDWGTQFGILLYAYKNLSEIERVRIKEDPFRYLNDLYVEENGKIEEKPERRERAKEEFAKLERGDKENRKIWQWMVEISMEKILETADDLGLLPFDEHRGESSYEKDMPEIVALALEKGAAKKLEDGAIVVDLEEDEKHDTNIRMNANDTNNEKAEKLKSRKVEEKEVEGLNNEKAEKLKGKKVEEEGDLGTAVLVKSDGASTYLLRDLATIKYRTEKWDFFKNIYVVDARQALHFRQVFKAAEMLGIAGRGMSEHIEFGFMSLPSGKMSTRKGNVIPLREVLDAVVLRAREIIREKNPDLKDAEAVARAVGVGALKYFDLSRHRKSNIIFDKEKALAFEGATGPYLQYAYARLRSVLRKVEKHDTNIRMYANDTNEDEKGKRVGELKMRLDLGDKERGLLVEAARFPEVVGDVLGGYAPNVLAEYLHKLAQRVNEFYHTSPIIQEEDEKKRSLRIALVEVASLTLKKGLYLLGIETVEEM